MSERVRVPAPHRCGVEGTVLSRDIGAALVAASLVVFGAITLAPTLRSRPARRPPAQT
jgi:hypothetical protein